MHFSRKKEFSLLSKSETEKKIHELGWWYLHFKFPNGAVTGTDKDSGYDADGRWKYFIPYIPKDLTGKTVLDIGGNSGYYSIQMKLRGAKKCVLVDPFVEFLAQAKFASEQFGVELDLINDDAHTFCLTTEERFDYVIFLGVLYHLKYPNLVLDRLSEMTKERIFIQSGLIGYDEPKNFNTKPDYAFKKEDEILEDPVFPKLTFVEQLYSNDPTNWWFPNYAGLEAMVRSAGLKVIARPHPEVIIAEPEQYFGKVVYPKLVFPIYGKKGYPTYPGPQSYDKKT